MDDSRLVSDRPAGESELADYLDRLISEALSGKALETPDSGRDQEEAATCEATPCEAAACEPAPGRDYEADSEPSTPEAQLQEKSLKQAGAASSGRRPGHSGRASMRDELVALFRPTVEPGPPASEYGAPQHSLDRPVESPSTAAEGGPSRYLREYLHQEERGPVVASTGVAELDTLLAGGLRAGLHLVLAEPEAGGPAFLDSVTWEAVASRRPVVFYPLSRGAVAVWERLVTTLADILGEATVPPAGLRVPKPSPRQLEVLTRLDAALQNSVLPFLSLVDSVPSVADAVGALLDDLLSRSQELQRQHGRSPVVVIDDLDQLLLLSGERQVAHLLARLDAFLSANAIPGIVHSNLGHHSAGVGTSVRTVFVLTRASECEDQDLVRIEAEVVSDCETGGLGRRALVFDRRAGLLA